VDKTKFLGFLSHSKKACRVFNTITLVGEESIHFVFNETNQ